MAHILDSEGTAGSIDERFRRFLLYIGQSELKDVISFPETDSPIGKFDEPIVIIDPVYGLNNVTARITETERQEIVTAASKAWETASFASIENDIEIWKELFGPRFRVEE